MRLLWVCLMLVAGSRADEVAPPCCGPEFRVSGQFEHRPVVTPVHAEAGADPGTFAQEIVGEHFVASVAGLPAGSYRVQVEAAETYHTGPDQRLMTVTCGKTSLADRLDLFRAAGGASKPFALNGVVEHADDSVDGPLAVTFQAVKDKATFSAINVFDATGKKVACLVAKDLVEVATAGAKIVPVVGDPVIYKDPDQPVERRVADLVRRMSLAEKVSELRNDAPAIERLGLPAYEYWNEALHGVARAGTATVFPQAIGLAATWDPALLGRVADVISTEGRAKYADAQSHGKHGRFQGLTFWSPNINIFRDPRWGRGQETYGEDPFLTSRMGVAFIRGLQGDDPKYYKTIACAKHFAVHSGPESERHRFDAQPPDSDLWDTYLPQFEAAVREGKVDCVMGAYNRVDGEACCSSPFLLEKVLRQRWGFQGYVVSDCGAINDISGGHHLAKTKSEASARAVKAGCDLECGNDYNTLVEAVNADAVSVKQIDTALERVLTGRFRLGMFDPPARVPYAAIPASANDTPEHDALALQSARAALVLLKNQGNLLPLDRAKIRRLAVVGPNADNAKMLLGNYNGTPSHSATILQGIREAAGPGVEVTFTKGCPLASKKDEADGSASPDFQKAVEEARGADAVVFVGGLDASLEGEQMTVKYEGFNGGDRSRIELPDPQEQLLHALQATGKPLVFVACTGSALAIPWEAENVPAILVAWYGGQRGGTAVADALFGEFSPAGRLPVTWYRATTDLPEFTDYRMANRTYRYFAGQPVFAFGHGLSYTTFRYGTPTVARPAARRGETVAVTVPVENTGGRDGEEVVQIYAKCPGTGANVPVRTLVAFQRVNIKRGEKQNVTLDVPVERLRLWNTAKQDYEVTPGEYALQVGASSSDIRGTVKIAINQ